MYLSPISRSLRRRAARPPSMSGEGLSSRLNAAFYFFSLSSQSRAHIVARPGRKTFMSAFFFFFFHFSLSLFFFFWVGLGEGGSSPDFKLVFIYLSSCLLCVFWRLHHGIIPNSNLEFIKNGGSNC